MSAVSSDRKPPVDYGVQIRFIKDLHDTGGVYADKSKAGSSNGGGGGGSSTPTPTNKYGVAVRVQGISGQPYVVLKDGEKGDSYGVQLNTPASSSGPPSPKVLREPVEVANPYSPAARSPAPAVDDEDGEVFGSPLRRPPGDGQAGTQVEDDGKAERAKAEPQVKTAAAAGGGVKRTEASKDWLREEAKVEKEEGTYNEAGLKPVRLNGVDTRGGGSTSSLGRHRRRQQSPDTTLASEPPAAAIGSDEPLPEVDTNSLAPINKLISKFNSGTAGPQQQRGRSGARQRLKFDERRRSRSLDARKEAALPPPASPTANPYAPLSTSTSSNGLLMSAPPVGGSLGRSSPTVPKVTAAAGASKAPMFKPSGRFVEKEPAPAPAPAPAKKRPEVPPRSHSTTSDETEGKLSFLNASKISSSENGRSLEREVTFKGGSDGTYKRGSHEELQEQLNRCREELQQAHDELLRERMSREAAESRVRLQEDQLAELQEELRRVSETSSDSLQTDVMTLQADLAEAAVLRQRQEETLRQRERELTALKGALKEEVECHDREMEALREQYGQDMENLRRTMEQVTQSQNQIEEERERVNASIASLEEELESSRDRGERWRMQLDITAQELQKTAQELLKSRLEKEELDGRLKDLQHSTLATKKPTAASDSSAEELRHCQDDLKQARASLDRQRGELDQKKEALEALKAASGEREAELLSEISRLKQQAQKDKAELEKAQEQAKESSAAGKTAVDHSSSSSLELQEANTRLRERLARMTKLHSSATRSSDAEETIETLEDDNRSLKSQLEESRRATSRVTKERDELSRRLEERDLEREALRRGKTDLEEQKRLLDRALEKMTKEMEAMMGESRQSVVVLQTQLDDYRERSRKDLQEAQRTNKERLAELQRLQSNLKAQQEEVSRLKKELLVCSEDRDSAQLERDLLNNRFKHLESERESERSSQTDRAREIRGLEDKIKTLEIELDEERSGVELLNDRITRSRDQVDQLRSELMQERSARHDLEMDKSALDRQMKELKSRVADMESQTRPTAGITLLESRIQELEERLRSEEREKNSIQASQRRMERKLKELNATLDQERSQHVEQRDQLSLRVKALKRQVDESEGEVERLEGVRRKVLRDLEEQQELQEALHAKVAALETDLKRKSQHTHRSALGSSALSSEDEDSFYDSNIASILNESHLQTSNC